MRALLRSWKWTLATAPVVLLLALGTHAAEVMIGQKDKMFSVKRVVLKKGDFLVFSNDDTVAHNVFSFTEGFKFNLKIQKPGEKASVRMEKTGKATVRCAIHPQMELEVIVEE